MLFLGSLGVPCRAAVPEKELEASADLLAEADALFDTLDSRGHGFIGKSVWEADPSPPGNLPLILVHAWQANVNRELVVTPLLDRLEQKRERISALLGTETLLLALKLSGAGPAPYPA